MSTPSDPTHSTPDASAESSSKPALTPSVDELIQLLLDGDLTDEASTDALIASIEDPAQVKHVADIQLIHAMLMQMSDSKHGRNEQRINTVMQKLNAEPAKAVQTGIPTGENARADNAVIGRVGRFFATPLMRWAVAASVVFAAIFFTANTGGTANASLERMIEAAAIDADRTYTITHDIGDGPPPAPFNTSADATTNDNNSGANNASNNVNNNDTDAHRGTPAPPNDFDRFPYRQGRPPRVGNGDRRPPEHFQPDDFRDPARELSRDPSRGKFRPPTKGERPFDPNRQHGRPRGPRSPHGFGPATLYVRGSNQFVLKRPVPSGHVIVGSNGKQSWIVPPSGSVYVSDDPRMLCAGPQGDLALPFLNISEGLDQLKDRYDIKQMADAPLPTQSPDQTSDTRLWHRLDGTKHATIPGPNQISLWAHRTTGIVQKVILNDFGSHHRRSFHPRRIAFDLQSTDDLPDDWFEHTAHHDADRTVETRMPRPHHGRRP